MPAFAGMTPESSRDTDSYHPGQAWHRRCDLAPAVHPCDRRRHTRALDHVPDAPVEPRRGTFAGRNMRRANNLFRARWERVRPRIPACAARAPAAAAAAEDPWILDKTLRPALAALLAGVPERIGMGIRSQRHIITNPGLDASYDEVYPIECLMALLE